MAILLGVQFWLSITIFFKVAYYKRKFWQKKDFNYSLDQNFS